MRLVTRGDLDGVTSAVLLTTMENIYSIELVHPQDITDKKFVAVTLGHNIFNRTSRADCGQICSDFGGGGHKGAGACPLKSEKAKQQIAEIIERLKKEG